ncbi:MAG: flagellar hook-length control protein FliK [Pseudoxanthomonas sp.]
MTAFAPAASGAAAASGANTTSPQDSTKDAAKPAFDDMVRRPAARDHAPVRKPVARDSEPREVAKGDTRTLRPQDDLKDTAPAEDDIKQDDTAPMTLLALLDAAPAVPTPALAAGTAVLVDTAAAPASATPSPTPFTPVTDAVLGQGTARVALPVEALPTAPTAEAAAADAATPTAAPTTPAAEAPAKAPLQNVLSFATHLATGQVAAALPDVVALGRDIVDAFRSEDGEGTVPTGNVLAGVGASHAPLGLSRLETVNATEAPTADLHGGHFDEDIGDAVRWMADQKIGHAHIKVTPNELGTVEIRLRLEGDRVHADFASTQADVRQALESSLPRLREMLGQQGFQLAHADVGHQHAPPSQDATPRHEAGGGDAADTAIETPRAVRMTALGLLDAYA